MDLTVVVLSWNTSALTVRALRAAADGAADLSFERICVDNASADDSVERVRETVPDARLLANPVNLGYAAGNNRALPHLRGRYTCFLNSDCAPAPGALRHLVRWMDAEPAVAISAPRLVGPEGSPQRAARPEPRPLGLLHRYTALRYTPIGCDAARAWRRGVVAEAPTDVASVTGACLLVRTEAFHALGGFDEGYFFYWEDVDLCRRARDAGWRVAYVPDGPPVVHEGGAATHAAGGPPRRAFAEGLLRYQRRRLPAAAAGAFALAFVLGLFVRALVDPVVLAGRALRRRARGRRAAARRTLHAAASWLRLLERDAAAVVRLLRPPR